MTYPLKPRLLQAIESAEVWLEGNDGDNDCFYDKARLRPLLLAMVEYINAFENYMGTSNMNAYDLVIDKRVALQALVESTGTK